jgi:hypothetical protein
MGKISSSRASLVTSPPRKSILLPTRITGTWTTSQGWNQGIQRKWAHWHQVDGIVVANMWVFDQMNLDCRPSILHIWRALCGFQTRGAVYLADQLAFYKARQLNEIRHKSLCGHTTWINDISCYILWCYFWGYGDFRNDMLDLCMQNLWIPCGQTSCITYMSHIRFLDEGCHNGALSDSLWCKLAKFAFRGKNYSPSPTRSIRTSLLMSQEQLLGANEWSTRG